MNVRKREGYVERDRRGEGHFSERTGTDCRRRRGTDKQRWKNIDSNPLPACNLIVL